MLLDSSSVMAFTDQELEISQFQTKKVPKLRSRHLYSFQVNWAVEFPARHHRSSNLRGSVVHLNHPIADKPAPHCISCVSAPSFSSHAHPMRHCPAPLGRCWRLRSATHTHAQKLRGRFGACCCSASLFMASRVCFVRDCRYCTHPLAARTV